VLTRISRRISLAAACLTTIGALAAAGPANAVILPPSGGSAPAPAQAAATRSAASAAAVPATVAVTATKLKSIPASYYIGFSFESSETDLSNIFSTSGEYPALLKNLGHGVLRFGGQTVDTPAHTGITTSNLNSLATLVTETGWKVNYSENLAYFNAGKVTYDARTVSAKLGANVLAYACGNEPDDYAPHRKRPAGYTEKQYLTEAAACFKAVHSGVPGAPIAGPNTFHTAWLPPYATAEKGKIQYLAEQYYPMSHCGSGSTGGSARLLSRATASAESATVASVASSAGAAGTPFVIGETNSASCSGLPGLSNTYAAALWAVDWVLLAAEKGATGIYFHGVLTTACNSYTPVCKTGTGTYVAEPVYYGLLFAHLLGTGQMLRTTVTTTADIAAHAVTSGGKASVVVENLSASPSALTLRVPGVSGTASVLHLTGGSLAATSGVRIQGAGVPPSGIFTPAAATRVTCTAGVCRLPVAAYSAVIVHLPA
jgi:hypothetical protein